MKQKSIIIFVVVAIIAIMVYFLMKKPSAPEPVPGTAENPEESKGVSFTWPWKKKDKTGSGSLQAPPEDFLPGFDEGEKLKYEGNTWIVRNGKWQIVP